MKITQKSHAILVIKSVELVYRCVGFCYVVV